MKKLPALLYGGSCRAVIVLKPTGESQIQNRGITNTNKDCEGNTKILTAQSICQPASYVSSITITVPIFSKCLILIFVSRMGSMNSICSWVCKQEGPWGHGWACVVMVGRCQLLMAAAWILPATQGLAPVQLYHWPTCPDNLEVPHVSSWIIKVVWCILNTYNTQYCQWPKYFVMYNFIADPSEPWILNF